MRSDRLLAPDDTGRDAVTPRDTGASAPGATALLRNHPNPLNGSNVLVYQASVPDPVNPEFPDIGGRLARSHDSGPVPGASASHDSETTATVADAAR